jgi:hypothetical protein
MLLLLVVAVVGKVAIVTIVVITVTVGWVPLVLMGLLTSHCVARRPW